MAQLESTPTRPEDDGGFVRIAAGLAALAGLLFGYDNTVISGAMLFIQKEFSLTPALEELVVSSHLVGAILFSGIGGILTDRIGRRRVLIGAAVVSGVGSFGTTLAPGPLSLMASRFVVGSGMALVAIASPLYTSELAPAAQRGRLVARYGFALTCGIFFANTVDYLFSAFALWRWMLGVGVLPAVVLGVGMLFLPESPRWLLSRGLVDDARSALRRMRSRGDVETELRALAGADSTRAGATWTELFGPTFRPALILGVGFALFRAIAGFGVIRFYGPEIFEAAGFDSPSDAILVTVGVTAVLLIMAFISMRLVDRLGRRPLFLTGFLGMGLSMILLGIVLGSRIFGAATPWIAMGSVVLFSVSFSAGPGPLFRLFVSEIYPTRMRGLGASVASMANSFANLVVSATFLTLADLLGRSGIFLTYGLLGFAAFIFMYVRAPETKGRTLEEIEAFWGARK